MVKLEEIARAAINGNALTTRSLVQDWLAHAPMDRDCRQPQSCDTTILAVAASVVESLAERSGDAPPAWTALIAPLREPLFLVRAAQTMPNLRLLCERETPAALRKRGIFAPPNYLTFA